MIAVAQLRGGLDLGEVLGRASQITEFLERMRKRRRERETPEAVLPEVLERLQALFPQQEIEQIAAPELQAAIRRHLPTGLSPEQEQRLVARGMELARTTMAPGRLRRKQEFQHHLTNLVGRFAETQAQNRALAAILARDNPELAQLAEGQLGNIARESMNTMVEILVSAFPDIQDDPEVRALIQRFRTMSVLPGATR
jgi:hypothetical protein